jgi:hypothetical protein
LCPPRHPTALAKNLANPTKAANEKFRIVRKADFAEVLRGVAFAPSSKSDDDDHEDHN